MEKIMKKLRISFVTITWILCSAALCTAADFCPSSLRWESVTVSIKPIENEVISSCEDTIIKSPISISSEKAKYKYGSTDYISEELIASEQKNQDY
jgi:hypothetical protein